MRHDAGSAWGDLSEPMRQAFVRYLRKKYGDSVARLREAFKDPAADFETVHSATLRLSMPWGA